MKLSTNTERVGSNIEDKKEFTIKASAKAFDVIINAMYTHKVRAVIRELSTNAYDSHIEAGTTKPFDVKLPTRLDTEFYIRDYGIGMTEEKVYTLYTVLFDSDKSDNNDLVGCLGIGSKAPFSYCKQFTVKTYVDGEAKLYSVFLDETGTPCISKVGEGPTNEENGVKVSLSVSPYDISEFVNEASDVFRWFEQKPNFIGVQPTFPQEKCFLKDNNWEITDGTNYLVMGNVCYKLEDKYEKLGELNKVLDIGLTIRADIGDVDISPSRERLQNTTKTILYLKRTLEDLKKNLTKATQEKINSIDSLYDAYIEYWKLPYRVYIDNITYKGQNLNYSISFKKEFTFNVDVTDPHTKITTTETRCINANLVTLVNGYNRRYNLGHLEPHPNYRFVMNDLRVGAYIRTKELCKNYNLDYYIVSKGGVDPTHPITQTIQNEVDDAFNNFSTRFGIPEKYILYASELDKPVYNLSRTKRSKVLKYARLYGSFTTCYANVEIDENTDGYYVLIKGYDILGTYKDEVNYKNFASFLSSLENIGIKLDFYALKEKDLKKFPKLKPFYPYVKGEVEKWSKQSKIEDLLTQEKINNELRYKKDIYAKISKYIPELKQVLKLDKVYDNNAIRYYRNINNYVGLNIEPKPVDLSLLKKYEFIEYLSSSAPDALLKEYVMFKKGQK